MTAASTPTSGTVTTLGRPRFQSIPAWLPPVALGVATALVLIIGRGGLLRLGFPVGAMAVAAWLYRRGPAPYLAFAWALWHVTPGLRRIVDYQLGGWDPQNPMSLAPFLASAFAIVGVISRLPELKRARFLPWVVAALTLLYGFFVGVLRMGLMPATHALISWFVPLALGLYCAVEWRRYPEYREAIRLTFVVGCLVIGAYGVFQFVNPPMWDRVWMMDSGMYSIGRAFPYEVRVFSLLNAPLQFALMLLAGLFLALSSRGAPRVLALVAGVVSLLLSLVRSAWLAGILGMLVYLVFLPRRAAGRLVLVGTVTLALVVVVPMAFPPDISKPTIQVVTDRVLTLTQLRQDVSYQERSRFLDDIADVVADNPIGRGIGSTGMSSTLSPGGVGMRDFDNGVFAVLYSLGWFGGTAFLLSALAILAFAMARREAGDDLVAKAARGILVAALALGFGSNVFEGVAASVLWGFAGLITAAHQFWEVEDQITAETEEAFVSEADLEFAAPLAQGS